MSVPATNCISMQTRRTTLTFILNVRRFQSCLSPSGWPIWQGNKILLISCCAKARAFKLPDLHEIINKVR